MSISNGQFGLVIAYLLPGFIGLAGIAPFAPIVLTWLQPLNAGQGNIGPPIYAILAATTLGMILGCLRWVLVDHLLEWMGITRPSWDDRLLMSNLSAFNYLVENHYRYYQFVGNSLLAVIGAYGVNRYLGTSPILGPTTDAGIIILCAVLFLASRDALEKYYARTIRLIGNSKKGPGDWMFNGNHNAEEASTVKPAQPQGKGKDKPQPAGKAEPKKESKSEGK